MTQEKLVDLFLEVRADAEERFLRLARAHNLEVVGGGQLVGSVEGVDVRDVELRGSQSDVDEFMLYIKGDFDLMTVRGGPAEATPDSWQTNSCAVRSHDCPDPDCRVVVELAIHDYVLANVAGIECAVLQLDLPATLSLIARLSACALEAGAGAEVSAVPVLPVQ